MSLRTPIVYYAVVGITLLLTILFGLFYQQQEWLVWCVVTTLVFLIGIPHGSADLLIFSQLAKEYYTKVSKLKLLGMYLGLSLSYAALWVYFPVTAFSFFIVCSIYHFGQSNWYYIKTESNFIKMFSYLSWGSFVLLTPILYHFEEASTIILGITHIENISIDSIVIEALPRELFALNIWCIMFLFFTNNITGKDVFREIFNLLVLSVLFYFTPLMIGFVVYFALWHSMSSLLDQVEFFKSSVKKFNIWMYYKKAMPILIISLIGIGLLIYVQPIYFTATPIIGLLFITLSLVTLPHILLIERLYHNMQNALAIT